MGQDQEAASSLCLQRAGSCQALPEGMGEVPLEPRPPAGQGTGNGSCRARRSPREDAGSGGGA